MDYEQTLKLIDAGFTADEIRKMATEGVKDKEAGAEDEGKKDEGKKEDSKQNNGTDEIAATFAAMTEQITKLADTVKSIQDDNIKNAKSGESKNGGDPVNETINSFLKEL